MTWVNYKIIESFEHIHIAPFANWLVEASNTHFFYMQFTFIYLADIFLKGGGHKSNK